VNAILAQMGLALGSGLIGGALWHSDVAFFFIDGLILVLGVAFVYVIANIAVFFYYRNERRSEFNPFLHFVFPLVSTAVLVFAILVSFQPLCQNYGTCPVAPYSFAPLVDGAWLLVGILVLVYYNMQKRQDWIRNAGAALGESDAELAAAKR
jgi:amino acid transporter